MSEKGMSRRDFLVSAGTYAASALASGGVIGAITPAVAAPALPWAYVALNPQTVGEAGYNNYAIGGCMYATGAALVNALATAVGAPWDSFNPDLFKYGGGGAAGWGTICGSLNAACAVIQMINPTGATAMINELFGWYVETPFPSTKFDAIAHYAVNQPTTVSKSPLCHQSSGIWSYTTGNRIGSNPRKDRCAKLSGDVAYKVVEMLNAWKAGTWTATYAAPDYQAETSFERCFTCHVGTTSRYDNAQGKMNCLTSGCHPNKATHHL